MTKSRELKGCDDFPKERKENIAMCLLLIQKSDL
jgi:hypothetical protein